MSEHAADEDRYGLGAGVTLKGATTVAIGPPAPVRVTRGDDLGIETVEYAVLMVVEIPTADSRRAVTLEFTALFTTDPNESDGEAFLQPSSLN